MLYNFCAQLLAVLQQGKTALIETTLPTKENDLEIPLRHLKSLDTPHALTTYTLPYAATFAHTYLPPERLILLGGGHIALPTCEFASKTGFNVIIVDDRPYFANTIRFPYATQTLCDSFPKAIHNLQPTANDYVAIITRGHKEDETCLKTLLESSWPQYVGLIGSRRRVTNLFDQLLQEGYDEEKLKTIHTPIGLSIGAQTPEEIAISILAELIQVKRLLHPLKPMPGLTLCYDTLSALEEILKLQEPFALVTILSTKGSTPRKAGTFMAVTALGKTIGSIGGGCSEHEVIVAARKNIGTIGYLLMTVDLTNDLAENEGMICGGTMEVLIEYA